MKENTLERIQDLEDGRRVFSPPINKGGAVIAATSPHMNAARLSLHLAGVSRVTCFDRSGMVPESPPSGAAF